MACDIIAKEVYLDQAAAKACVEQCLAKGQVEGLRRACQGGVWLT